MQGRIHRPALMRVGEGKVASPDAVAAFVREGKPGARCVYAAGPHLPASLTADLARRFSEQGRAHLVQARSAAGFDYILQVADPARAKRDAARDAADAERRAETALLGDIERHLAAADMAPSVFGLKAVGDAKLIWRLRQGLKVKRAEMEAARRWMAEHPPAATIAAGARKAAG